MAKGEIGILIFLGIVAIALTIMAIIYYSELRQCETKESPYCLQYMCKTPDNECESFAFRIGDDGKKQCSQPPTTTSS